MDPIRLTLGEAIVMLNRVGLTIDVALQDRAPFEVEGLLMSEIAQREAVRERESSGGIPIVENRVGEAAPGWVNDLPEEEG